jgi:hypothetical protein
MVVFVLFIATTRKELLGAREIFEVKPGLYVTAFNEMTRNVRILGFLLPAF